MGDTKIQFKTAELAHSKGFKAKTKRIYPSTQTSLHKWLRETYKLHIVIRQMGFIPYEYQSAFPFKGKNHVMPNLPTYEEALEVALFEALKLVP
jgi:hypothetical protein